ncbi:MAG: 30S ribosomal protein S8 [Chloroflexi bacterium]|nr:30S ribosomal protein S8 [Chloroflexota bacterium]
MNITDPIADMLTRLRNAAMARHPHTTMPVSKMKLAIARILKEEGFIKDFEIIKQKNTPQQTLRIWLKYGSDKRSVMAGSKRISKPGLRVYVKRTEMPRVLGGLGIAIVTTPKGVMTSKQAWLQRVGGEVLCYVW